MRSLPTSAATVLPDEQSGVHPAPPKRPARRKLWFFTALSVVAGVAATSALREMSPSVKADVRSGSPGFKQSSTGKNVHWQKNAVTVYLDDSLSRLGPGTNEAVMQAFGSWVQSDPNLPNLTFDTIRGAEAKQDGKSTVTFGRITQPGHERDVAITITYSDDKTGEILEADVILNATYAMGVLKARHSNANSNSGNANSNSGNGNGNWKHDDDERDDAESQECASRYDAQNVATHEAGHFFGLGEDMVEQKATMFLSIGQCETHKRELALTDVTAVKTLYAETASAEEKAAGPRACSFVAAPAGSAGWSWPAAIAVGVLLGRRRRSR
jgi:hypothetical protein